MLFLYGKILMKKINKNNKENLLVLMYIIFIEIFILLQYGFVILILLIPTIFLLRIAYDIYVSLRNKTFFVEEINVENYEFDIQDCDLIRNKANEWLEEANRRSFLPNDKLDKLEYFYNDFEQINLSLLPELEDILKFKGFFGKKSNLSGSEYWIYYLSKNLMFLIYLKEKDFDKAYEVLKELDEVLTIEISREYIFNQTIDGKKLILVYLLEYKNSGIVDSLIKLLFKFNNKVRENYLRSLDLSEEDINYLLEKIN